MNIKNKEILLQVSRIAVQVVFFIILPGLYVSILAGIKSIYLGIINNNLDLVSSFTAVISLFAVIIVTVVLGRFFCGWMCTFGAVCDWLYIISKKIFQLKFEMPEKIDNTLKKFKYFYLLILVVVLWNLDYVMLDMLNPWGAFGTIFTINGFPDIRGAFEYYSIGTILLVLILAASICFERFFCRYLCPLGAIYSLISRFKVMKIEKNRNQCGNCKVCTKNCSMGITLYKNDVIISGECIQCQRCLAVCPRDNIAQKISNKKVNPVVISAIAVIAITVIYFCGSIYANTLNIPNTSAKVISTTGQYLDGTYNGSGTGFRGGITNVSVIVRNGNITVIEVLSYQDDKPFLERVKSKIITQIIENQSTKVDVISGATFSSKGIIEAVDNALSNAK